MLGEDGAGFDWALFEEEASGEDGVAFDCAMIAEAGSGDEGAAFDWAIAAEEGSGEDLDWSESCAVLDRTCCTGGCGLLAASF